MLDNEVVDVIAELRPIPNADGRDSISLTFWVTRENKKILNPILDEECGTKIRDWLLLFDKQLDSSSIRD